MKFGNYDLGEPIEFGFTGEQQLYYCSRECLPGPSDYKENYQILSQNYNTNSELNLYYQNFSKRRYFEENSFAIGGVF